MVTQSILGDKWLRISDSTIIFTTLLWMDWMMQMMVSDGKWWVVVFGELWWCIGGIYCLDTTVGSLSERQLTRGHFKRDNRSTREPLLERLNNTGKLLLIVLLLLVNHCTPSHIIYAIGWFDTLWYRYAHFNIVIAACQSSHAVKHFIQLVPISFMLNRQGQHSASNQRCKGEGRDVLIIADANCKIRDAGGKMQATGDEWYSIDEGRCGCSETDTN